jgi:hypothetical protein
MRERPFHDEEMLARGQLPGEEAEGLDRKCRFVLTVLRVKVRHASRLLLLNAHRSRPPL